MKIQELKIFQCYENESSGNTEPKYKVMQESKLSSYYKEVSVVVRFIPCSLEIPELN